MNIVIYSYYGIRIHHHHHHHSSIIGRLLLTHV